MLIIIKYVSLFIIIFDLINQKMISFTEILVCEGTVLYEIYNQDLTFKTSGPLQVLIAFDGMVLLKINDFEYGVNPTD